MSRVDDFLRLPEPTRRVLMELVLSTFIMARAQSALGQGSAGKSEKAEKPDPPEKPPSSRSGRAPVREDRVALRDKPTLALAARDADAFQCSALPTLGESFRISQSVDGAARAISLTAGIPALPMAHDSNEAGQVQRSGTNARGVSGQETSFTSYGVVAGINVESSHASGGVGVGMVAGITPNTGEIFVVSFLSVSSQAPTLSVPKSRPATSAHGYLGAAWGDIAALPGAAGVVSLSASTALGLSVSYNESWRSASATLGVGRRSVLSETQTTILTVERLRFPADSEIRRWVIGTVNPFSDDLWRRP